MTAQTKAVVTEALYGMILAGRELNDRQIAAVADAVVSAGVTASPHDALLDQGVTRLQLLSFLRGDESPVWNWNGKNNGPRWVRYRGHSIERDTTPDSGIVRLTHTDHDGTTRDATWDIGGSDYDAYAVVRMADFIIDAVIAEYGTGLGA